MFNLEQAIAEWRRQMMAAGITGPESLDELEGHLRDDIERRVRSGMSEQQAFESGVRKIGQADSLQAEFVKVGKALEPRYCKFTRICCYVSAAVFALLSARQFLALGMSSGERLLGIAIVVAITAYLCSLPYASKVLRAFKRRRTEVSVQMAVTVIWLVSGVFILANLSSNAIAGSLWVAMSIVAVLVWVPRMIEYDSGLQQKPGGQGPPPPGGGPLQPNPFSPIPIPGPRPLPPEVAIRYKVKNATAVLKEQYV